MQQSSKRFSKNKSLLGIIGVLVVIWFGFNTTKIIFKNFDLVQEIEQLEQEIAILELQNANLKFQIGYYKTDAYTEIQARDKLGLVAVGEKLLILPEDRYDDLLPKAGSDAEPVAITNFNAWMEFLFGKN